MSYENVRACAGSTRQFSFCCAIEIEETHISTLVYIYVYMHGVLSNLSDGDIFFFPLCFANVTFVTTIRSCFYSSTLLPVISAIQTEENCPFFSEKSPYVCVCVCVQWDISNRKELSWKIVVSWEHRLDQYFYLSTYLSIYLSIYIYIYIIYICVIYTVYVCVCPSTCRSMCLCMCV